MKRLRSAALVYARLDRVTAMTALWSYRPCRRASSIEMVRLETTGPISQTAHFHSEVQVATVIHGYRVYSSPLVDLCVSAGDMVIIPAHLPHASKGNTASIVTHLYIPSDHPSVRGMVAPAASAWFRNDEWGFGRPTSRSRIS